MTEPLSDEHRKLLEACDRLLSNIPLSETLQNIHDICAVTRGLRSTLSRIAELERGLTLTLPELTTLAKVEAALLAMHNGALWVNLCKLVDRLTSSPTAQKETEE